MAFKPSEPIMDRAFVVMMNLKTGQLLSISGKKLVNKDGNIQVEDYALGTIACSL